MERIYKYGADEGSRGVERFEHDILESPPEEMPALPEEVEEAPPLDPEAVRQQVIAEAMTEARSEAELKVKEAYEEGLRRGLEDGEKKFAESIAQSAQLLNQAATEMQAAHQHFLDSLEPEVFELVRLVCARVVGREIATDKELVLRTVRRALECLSHESTLRIHANPDDLEALKTHRIALLEEFEGVKHLELAADPEIPPGGCTVDSERMHVDARLETLLEHVLSELAD